MIDSVWGGAVVSPATVAKRVELLRQSLSDDSQDPRYIRLVRGHGYRMAAEVELVTEPAAINRLPLFAIGVVIAALAAGIGWYAFHGPDDPMENSLVVLPFASISTDPADAVFADGLTEELSHALASVPELKVIGRSSSFHFRGRNEDIREIGQTLDVEHLLEGSVRRSGDQLRITAQLVKTEDGFRVWSQTYDRNMADVLSIQEDIAHNVAAKLRASVFTADVESFARDRDVDPYAYALYLRALGLSRGIGMSGLAEAQGLLEQAVEVDPGFATAWARLAVIQGRRLMGSDETYPYPPEAGWQRVIEANDTALTLDPGNAWALANLGGIAWIIEGDAAKAAPLFERAVESSRGELEIIVYAASFAKHVGHVDQAIGMEQYLIARDPHCVDCRSGLAKSYMFAGRYEEAEATFETLRIMLGYGSARNLGLLRLVGEDPQAALEWFDRIDRPEFYRVQGRAMALHDLGRIDEFGATMQDLVKRWGNDRPLVIGEAFAYAGMRDAAFDWLEKSVAASKLRLQTDYLEPSFNRIRSDHRWQPLLAEVGRSDEQLRTIEFTVDLPD